MMSPTTALDRGPQHRELALRTMLYEPGSLRLQKHKGFLRVIDSTNRPIFSIKIDKLKALFARLGNVRVPAPISTSSSVPHPFFVRAPAEAVSFAGASVVPSYAVFSLRAFKRRDREWSCLGHAAVGEGLRSHLGVGAQDTSRSEVFAHLFSRALDSTDRSATVSRAIDSFFAIHVVDFRASLYSLGGRTVSLISGDGSSPPPFTIVPVIDPAPAFEPVGGESWGGVEFMRRNWRWIAVGVGVVAVVTLVALALIFGVPAPIAGLATNIAEGARNVATEGWRRLVQLLSKV